MEQQQQSHWDTIESRFRTPLGFVQLVRGTWDQPFDTSATMHEHHLELNLLPIPGGARARFVDHWAPNRFEPFGEMFFLPAKQRVHFKSHCRQQNSVTCDFDPAALDDWFERRLPWRECLLHNVLNLANSRIRSLLCQLIVEMRNPGFAREAMIELLVSQAAIELARHLQGMDGKSVTGGLTPHQLRLIDERLADVSSQPNLGELAALCNLSVRHLSRAFRASRGRSVGHYIAAQRAELARSLIASGMSIKAVAYTMGYSAPSNFTAAFVRATGETPRLYRQRVRGKRNTIRIAEKPVNH